jgi:Penicillin-Binding Protein C-terminus Family
MPETQLAGSLPQVRTPTSGEVIAIDPDNPAAHQRIAFASDDLRAAQRWVLNGQDLGPVTAPVLWQPVPGKHPYRLSMTHDASSIR